MYTPDQTAPEGVTWLGYSLYVTPSIFKIIIVMFCVSEVLGVLRQAQSVGANDSIINDKASF